MPLLLLAFALALVPSQDKITLKFKPKEGDKLVKSERTEMSVQAKVVAGEQEQELQFEQKDSQKMTMEFAEVANGAVARSVLVWQTHLEEKKGPPTGEWIKKEMPLQGRTITLSMKDGLLVRDGADGLDEKLIKKLDLADRSSRLFPKTPVAPGDTWEVEGEDVRKFLAADNDLKDAKVKVKLLEVKEIDGRRCAVLNTAMELAGKGKGEVDLTIKLDAEVIIWIERGYTL